MPDSRTQGGSEDKGVLKIDGAFAPKVLRFDSPFRAEGCGGGSAASIYAACRQRWWTPLKMKGAMMIKPGSRTAGEARLYGFSFRRAELQNSSPKGDTFPSEPFEPSEPSEPSRRRRVQWRYHHPRPKGPSPPSTQPAAVGGHNLQPRRGWPPSPLNPLNLHGAAALCLIPYGFLLLGRRGA